MNEAGSVVHETPQAVVVRPALERIHDAAALGPWTETEARRSSGPRHVLLDFSNVRFISSAALNKLVVLQQDLRKCGKRLVLFGLTSPIEAVISVTRLDEIFSLAPDEPSAWQTIGCSRDGPSSAPPR